MGIIFFFFIFHTFIGADETPEIIVQHFSSSYSLLILIFIGNNVFDLCSWINLVGCVCVYVFNKLGLFFLQNAQEAQKAKKKLNDNINQLTAHNNF